MDLDQRIAAIKNGSRPDWACRDDTWFAWYPVRTGALGTGSLVWLKRVWRSRCCGVTIYQRLRTPEEIKADAARVADYVESLITYARRRSGGPANG